MSEVHETKEGRDPFSRLSPTYDVQKAATPDRVRESGYYGLPILKRPFWKWEIAMYFFFEGISAGSYILCTMADIAGNARFEQTVRRGRILSLLTLAPCPPLLITDLGRPERFHHMLRIFKRTSPMNHGAWALSGFGAFAAATVAQQLPIVGRIIPRRTTALLGMPFAWTMVSYPGVLLSTTSIPVWAKTNFLGPLFASSSMSAAAAALTLCGGDKEVLRKFEDVASAAEAVSLAGYLITARTATKPLLSGKQSKLFLCGAVAAGLIAPVFLRCRRPKIAALLTIAGSLALKWSVTYAAQESALDAGLAVENSPTKTGEPFWGPNR